MKTTGNCTKLVAGLVGIAALALLSVAPAFAAPQASITLSNCNSELCNANNTEWTLDKTPSSQTLTGDNTITWTVDATRGATSATLITVNGVMTVTNTGSAPATIGNIVVNLQKPRTGPNSGACRNIPWVSAAADVADATHGDTATSANIVAAGSQENVVCNIAQGPLNYTVSSALGRLKKRRAPAAWSLRTRATTPYGPLRRSRRCPSADPSLCSIRPRLTIPRLAFRQDRRFERRPS